MKKVVILSALLLLVGAPAFTRDVGDNSFGGRASLSVDWKVLKGLHVGVEYEIRSTDKFKGVERNQVGASVSYKFNSFLRVAGGYDYIGHFNSERELKPRHRGYLDVIGTYNVGYWRFSLKERLQLTHKSYDLNKFQNPVNDIGLKSRLKVTYRGHQTLSPYAFLELRNGFNGASYSADFDPQTGKYTNYKFTGYHYASLDRVRMSLGVEWSPAKHHTLDFGLLVDRNSDRSLDVNSSGTKLKSVILDKYWAFNLAIGYVFSF